MSVRVPEVVKDNGVELGIALRTDHFDEVFVYVLNFTSAWGVGGVITL